MSVFSREELGRLADSVVRFDTGIGITEADWDRIYRWASLARIQAALLDKILVGEVIVAICDDELTFTLNPQFEPKGMTHH